MVEAGDAWMRQVRHDNLISRSHQVLASVFGELGGVGHKVEHVTAGGYFSMRVYLSKRIVAVEFDRATHYLTPAALLVPLLNMPR